MPQQWEKDPNVLTLNPNSFKFTPDVTSCDVIDAAIQQYQRIIKLSKEASVDSDLTAVVQLQIQVENKTCGANFYPSFTSDESCKLFRYEYKTCKVQVSSNNNVVLGATSLIIL